MSRRFNIIVTVVVSTIFLGLTAVFWQSYVRFGEACKDFGLSVAYYVCELFGIDYSFAPTVTDYSGAMQWEIFLPDDWEGFTSSAGNFFSLLIEGENFAGYWAKVGDVMLVAAKVVAILLPCIIVLLLVIYRMVPARQYKTQPRYKAAAGVQGDFKIYVSAGKARRAMLPRISFGT